jgi:hypothetical protein
MSDEPKDAMELYYQPDEAGAYVLGGSLHFHVKDRPNWFHQMMTRVLLGWVWKDRHE